jgi:hypothetical protein
MNRTLCIVTADPVAHFTGQPSSVSPIRVSDNVNVSSSG